MQWVIILDCSLSKHAGHFSQVSEATTGVIAVNLQNFKRQQRKYSLFLLSKNPVIEKAVVKSVCVRKAGAMVSSSPMRNYRMLVAQAHYLIGSPGQIERHASLASHDENDANNRIGCNPCNMATAQ